MMCSNILLSPEPKFVGSAVIPDNDDRDDDKVYFFFTEHETDAAGLTKAVYTRVGRVCAVSQHKHTVLKAESADWTFTINVCLRLSERPGRTENAGEQMELLPEKSSHLLCRWT